MDTRHGGRPSRAMARTPSDEAHDSGPSLPEESATGSAPELSDKVRRLFATLRRPDGREYTPDQVEAALREKYGEQIVSSSYLYMLIRGTRDNPSKKVISALADFFHVPVAYFFDDDAGARLQAELDMLAALRDADVLAVARRSAGLSPASLTAIRTIIEEARRIEGLGGDPQGPAGSTAAP